MQRATVAAEFIAAQRRAICDLSDRVWALAEVGLHEHGSAAALAQVSREHGFEVRAGVAEMPSAFEASWGSGRPVIGLLGEYDALPGLSQAAVAERRELEPGAAGHGCGHNLLGVAALAAALGLKAEMQACGLGGTVKYFGCPAEENFSGEAFMAREGLFGGCDACLTWHPGGLNIVRPAASLAVTSMNVTFSGRTAHAAADPHHGRSALDALQLFNLGVEFLREHISPQARLHYVITDGGAQPNVVPDRAKVWYYVRSPRHEEVEELRRRVLRCASGAAEMTETSYEDEVLEATYELLPNEVLGGLLAECLARVGPPAFTDADRGFAQRIAAGFEPGQKATSLEALFEGTAVPPELMAQTLNETVVSAEGIRPTPRGSTDVADVSWCCPTAQFSMACYAIGTPGHSWQIAAQSGTGVGHAGMIAAAKVLAEAGMELLTRPKLLELARAEFLRRTGGKPFRSALPEGLKPPFHQLAGMAATRGARAPRP